MNAYEAGQQKIIPAVLLYAFFEGRVLMIHRNQKKEDVHQGKWNGLGGKLEVGETALECSVREFQEESECKTQAEQWQWMGHLAFPDFKPQKNEDWLVTVYRAELTRAQFQQISEVANAEGTLHWIPQEEVMNLNLWDGDRHFIPFMLKNSPFQGTFFYVDGKLDRFFCEPIIR